MLSDGVFRLLHYFAGMPLSHVYPQKPHPHPTCVFQINESGQCPFLQGLVRAVKSGHVKAVSGELTCLLGHS